MAMSGIVAQSPIIVHGCGEHTVGHAQSINQLLERSTVFREASATKAELSAGPGTLVCGDPGVIASVCVHFEGDW